MKKLMVAAACTLCALFTLPAFASKADGKKAKLIAKYDKNGNGVIDGDEREAIRKDYAANPNGALKAYDTNNDGKLTDEEIAAIKPGSGSPKSGGKTKAKKSKSGEESASARKSAATNETSAAGSEKKEK
jgi:EF hand